MSECIESLPVALLSMRPLVGANRHYSTVCHNAIRWFCMRFAVRTMQIGYDNGLRFAPRRSKTQD